MEKIIIYPIEFTIDISLNVTRRINEKNEKVVLNLQFRDITIFKFERGEEDDYEEVEQGFRLKIIDGVFHLTLTVPPKLYYPYGIETTENFLDKKFYVLSNECFYKVHSKSHSRLIKLFYNLNSYKKSILRDYAKGVYSRRYLSRLSKVEIKKIKEIVESEYGEVKDL